MIPDDELMTPERKALRELYSQRGIVPAKEDFRCPSLRGCSPKAEPDKMITGTYAYVGTAYGQIRVDGHPVKVLIVAMDKGGYESRAGESLAEAQESFRSHTETPNNAHMWGVQWLLRTLCDDKNPTVFSRQYALTNAVKCTQATGRMAANRSPTMIHNCAEHLCAEIKLLRPDLLITQGAHPENTVLRMFQDLRSVAQFPGDTREAEVLVGQRFVVLTTPHPAHCPGWNWKRGPLPKFLSEAASCAKRELLGLTASASRI